MRDTMEEMMPHMTSQRSDSRIVFCVIWSIQIIFKKVHENVANGQSTGPELHDRDNRVPLHHLQQFFYELETCPVKCERRRVGWNSKFMKEKAKHLVPVRCYQERKEKKKQVTLSCTDHRSHPHILSWIFL